MQSKKEPTEIDVLKRMKYLLRRGWTQFTNARGKTGREVDDESSRAVAFCLYGAAHRAVADLNGSPELNGNIDRRIRMCTGRLPISIYNDKRGRKKSEVIAVVDCAIKKAREQEAT